MNGKADVRLQPSSTFVRDVLRLVTGTAGAQLITLLAAPVLTRIFSPSDYGVAAVFVGITSVLGVAACARYELAIVLPSDDREAANVLALSLLCVVGISFFLVPFGLLFPRVFPHYTQQTGIRSVCYLIPFAVLASGVFTALTYWAARTKKFTSLAIANFSAAGIGTCISLYFGLTGQASGTILVASVVASQCVAALVLAILIRRGSTTIRKSDIRWSDILAAAYRYREFPIFSSWSSLLSLVGWQLPALLLGVYFSSAVVGAYSMGIRMIQLPMLLVGRSIAQVFLVRATEAKSDGSLGVVTNSVLLCLARIMFFPMLLLTVVGTDLFVFIFGPQWQDAGLYIRILSPWAFVWFLASPLSTVFIALEKQKQELFLQVIIFASRLVSIVAGGYYGSPALTVALLSLTGVFAYAFLLARVCTLSNARYSDILGEVSSIVLPACVLISLVLAARIGGSSEMCVMLVSMVAIVFWGVAQKRLILSTLRL